MKALSPSIPYEPWLMKQLRRPDDAAAYLEVVIEENDQPFINIALRNVAEAQGGLAKLAKKAGLNRVSLYRMLSDKGNPELSSLLKIIQALGLRLTVQPVAGRTSPAGKPKRIRKGPLAAKRPLRVRAPRPKSTKVAR